MKTGFVLAALAICAAMPALIAPAQAGVGAAYGTRNPIACPDKSQPRSGAPSPAQAAHYLACDQEQESGRELYLVGDVKLQVAARARAYDPNHDAGSQVDPSKPVYDIRGSFRHYQCQPLDGLDAKQNPGKSCNVSNETGATGTCYHDTFGDWHCTALDVMHIGFSEYHVPAPK